MTNGHARQVLGSTEEEEVFSTSEDIEFQKLLVEYVNDSAKAFAEYYESLDTSNVASYLVGGAVREIIRGFPEKVKDWDFAVEAESFLHMKKWLEEGGFEIFLETPQYFTIRARAPKDTFIFGGLNMTGRTFDFTLCRKEGDYSDGRRPDQVEVGTLEEDLSRRDFTINAMALDSSGNLIDPFLGQIDIQRGLIRCVGSTERLREDSLRMLRAIRFAVQLRFDLHSSVLGFLKMSANAELLENVDENRIRDELTKCFKADTLDTLELLNEFPFIRNHIFEETDIWLMPTVKGK